MLRGFISKQVSNLVNICKQQAAAQWKQVRHVLFCFFQRKLEATPKNKTSIKINVCLFVLFCFSFVCLLLFFCLVLFSFGCLFLFLNVPRTKSNSKLRQNTSTHVAFSRGCGDKTHGFQGLGTQSFFGQCWFVSWRWICYPQTHQVVFGGCCFFFESLVLLLFGSWFCCCFCFLVCLFLVFWIMLMMMLMVISTMSLSQILLFCLWCVFWIWDCFVFMFTLRVCRI